MLSKKLVLILVVAFMAAGALQAQDYEYIGAAKCKICHNKPATGQQYKIWSEGPHANAMKALESDEAKAIAKEKGIADPTTDPSCTKCHSTYARIDQNSNISLTETEGVSCETCHGPGSKYKSKSIMESQEKSIANGLIIPDEKLCKECHNAESPTFKSFNYEEAKKKIAHPVNG